MRDLIIGIDSRMVGEENDFIFLLLAFSEDRCQSEHHCVCDCGILSMTKVPNVHHLLVLAFD